MHGFSLGQFIDNNLFLFSVRAQLVLSVKVYCGIKASRQVFIGIVKIDLNDFDSEINCHSLMSLSVSVMGGKLSIGN